MREKTKTISIRISEYQYKKLVDSAEKAGYENVSEYARKTLFTKYQENNSGVENYEKLNKRELSAVVGKELIRMQCVLEKMKDTEETEHLKKEVGRIWQLLN